jgi:hypothetical protein
MIEKPARIIYKNACHLISNSMFLLGVYYKKLITFQGHPFGNMSLDVE